MPGILTLWFKRRNFLTQLFFVLDSFAFKCQMSRKKPEQVQPPLKCRHCPLVVTTENQNESGPPRVRPRFNGSLLEPKKESKHQKQKNVNDTSLHRGTRGGHRSMGHRHYTAGRENKQAMHEWSALSSPSSYCSSDCKLFYSSPPSWFWLQPFFFISFKLLQSHR